MHASLRRTGLQLTGSAVTVLLTAGLYLVLPRLVGVTWKQVLTTVTDVGSVALLVLVGVWLLGLVVHGFVMTAALPGLSLGRALTLNLSGSAVSNVLPIGAAAGVGVGYAMSRSWHISRDRFASFIVVSHVWNAGAKVVVGFTLLGAAALVHTPFPRGTAPAAAIAAVSLSAMLLAALCALRSEAAAHQGAARLARLLHRSPAWADRLEQGLVATRRATLEVSANRWQRMSVLVLTYVALQGVLLALCLSFVHAQAAPAAVATAFAVERLLTLAPITPAASGAAELGAVAVLTSLGVPPVGAAGGVVLYRFVLVALEVPVGSLLALGWWHRTGRRPSGAPVPQEAGAR